MLRLVGGGAASEPPPGRRGGQGQPGCPRGAGLQGPEGGHGVALGPATRLRSPCRSLVLTPGPQASLPPSLSTGHPALLWPWLQPHVSPGRPLRDREDPGGRCQGQAGHRPLWGCTGVLSLEAVGGSVGTSWDSRDGVGQSGSLPRLTAATGVTGLGPHGVPACAVDRDLVQGPGAPPGWELCGGGGALCSSHTCCPMCLGLGHIEVRWGWCRSPGQGCGPVQL